MVNKVSFVGESFTRKPPKFERFIRPAALRFKKAHVTHPELKATFQLDLIGEAIYRYIAIHSYSYIYMYIHTCIAIYTYIYITFQLDLIGEAIYIKSYI